MSRCSKYEWKRSGFSETGNTKLSVINAPSSFVVVDVMTVIRAVLKCTRRDAATTPGNLTCNAIQLLFFHYDGSYSVFAENHDSCTMLKFSRKLQKSTPQTRKGYAASMASTRRGEPTSCAAAPRNGTIDSDTAGVVAYVYLVSNASLEEPNSFKQLRERVEYLQLPGCHWPSS